MIWPRLMGAQEAGRLPRVVYLSVTSNFVANFREGLAELGRVDGKLLLEIVTPPTQEEMPAFAARAVASKPDVIAVVGGTGAVAIKALTTSIPTVFIGTADPVGLGLAVSLAHPGGNFTGNTNIPTDLVGKDIELLAEVVPGLRRIAILSVAGDPAMALIADEVIRTARSLGLDAVAIAINTRNDFVAEFQTVSESAAQGVFIPSNTYFSGGSPLRPVLREQLLRARLPSVSQAFNRGANPPMSALISYGPDARAGYREAASYVDAILKGIKPADLPIAQPTVFELAVDLAAAKAIGITIPPSVLARATQVLE